MCWVDAFQLMQRTVRRANDAKFCEAIEMEALTADDSTCTANVIFTVSKRLPTDENR
jgi:hypothetical protein